MARAAARETSSGTSWTARAPRESPSAWWGASAARALCGGLGPAPAPKAWVLADDVTAVWVIGKEPAGKGWRLDPAYPADTSRWLEVIGRV